MIRRNIAPAVLEALSDRPVVLLHGARQTGKSTLVAALSADEKPPRTLITMDDPVALSAATSDPAGFLAGMDVKVALDEVQRAPGLFVAIKAAVDRDRRPGRFLLTGSADALMLPKLSESLAGRVEIATLWPLSQGELEGTRERFVDLLFEKRLPGFEPAKSAPSDTAARIARGGFPELASKGDRARPEAWFKSYVSTILQRDVLDIARIEGLATLPRLLALLASRTGSILNFADLSRSSGLPQSTLKRYMALLETVFLVRVLPPWFVNVGKRLVKAPKVYVTDTGLAAHLIGADAARIRGDGALIGPLLETFVIMEILKQSSWSKTGPGIFYYRTSQGSEVDVLLEDRSGRVAGVEIKASATVTSSDFKGLRDLEDSAGSRFVRGIVLYRGPELVPFAKNLHAVPLEALWNW